MLTRMCFFLKIQWLIKNPFPFCFIITRLICVLNEYFGTGNLVRYNRVSL